MEQQIDSSMLTVSSESLESSEHILIHVEAPNDLHMGRSDRSGTENEDCSNCSQTKNQIRKLTNQVKTLQTKLNDHRKNRKRTKRWLGKSFYYFTIILRAHIFIKFFVPLLIVLSEAWIAADIMILRKGRTFLILKDILPFVVVAN